MPADPELVHGTAQRQQETHIRMENKLAKCRGIKKHSRSVFFFAAFQMRLDGWATGKERMGPHDDAMITNEGHAQHRHDDRAHFEK